MELTTELIRKHLGIIYDVLDMDEVKSHQRRSKKGKLYTVKAFDRKNKGGVHDPYLGADRGSAMIPGGVRTRGSKTTRLGKWGSYKTSKSSGINTSDSPHTYAIEKKGNRFVLQHLLQGTGKTTTLGRFRSQDEAKKFVKSYHNKIKKKKK